MTTKRTSPLLIVSTGLLMAGNIIGAGILGLPINTGPAGLRPTLVAMLGMWVLMFISAWIIAHYSIAARKRCFDLPSLFGKALGPVVRWLAIVSNLVILYGLLVAYLEGASSIILELFAVNLPRSGVILGVFVGATLLTVFGLKLIRRSNALMMIGLVMAFVGMLYLGFPWIEMSNVLHTNWSHVPLALPIMVTAFHFHNIIPSVCRSLEWDERGIQKALFIGSLIGLMINVAWVIMVMGVLPLRGSDAEISILYALANNQPATIPLAKLLHSPLFTFLGMLFAFLAILTSYLANGSALMSFMGDLFNQTLGYSNRAIEVGLAFLVPLGIALFYSNIFLQALDIVGGVGIVVLFGILPGLLFIKDPPRRLSKKVGYLLVIVFSFILVVQLAHMIGLI